MGISAHPEPRFRVETHPATGRRAAIPGTPPPPLVSRLESPEPAGRGFCWRRKKKMMNYSLLFFVKRKQSQIGAALEEYVEFKRSQTNKTLAELKEKKKEEEQFSMRKCVSEMDTIDGLTDEEKSYAVELFESQINREVFMSTMNHNVRIIWLKRKIRLLRGSDAWPQQMI